MSFLPFARNPGDAACARCCTRRAATGRVAAASARREPRALQPRVPAWRAVRTTRWLFVDYDGGQRELYDLKRDPGQLRSLSGDPRFRVRLRTLRRGFCADLSECSGTECREQVERSVR